jgi:hypothetical protein
MKYKIFQNHFASKHKDHGDDDIKDHHRVVQIFQDQGPVYVHRSEEVSSQDEQADDDSPDEDEDEDVDEDLSEGTFIKENYDLLK